MAADADFDPDRLSAFLRSTVPALRGAMRLDRIGGGQSSPTYEIHGCEHVKHASFGEAKRREAELREAIGAAQPKTCVA